MARDGMKPVAPRPPWVPGVPLGVNGEQDVLLDIFMPIGRSYAPVGTCADTQLSVLEDSTPRMSSLEPLDRDLPMG